MEDAPASLEGVYAALRSRRASPSGSGAASVRRRAALRTYGRHLALVAGIKLLAVLAGRGRGPGGPLPFAAG